MTGLLGLRTGPKENLCFRKKTQKNTYRLEGCEMDSNSLS